MTTTIRIACVAPPRGQFVQLAWMPRSTPPFLTSDRAWVRRIREMPDSSLYAIEAWGESTSIAPGGQSLAVEPADPMTDVPPLTWPTIEAIRPAFIAATASLGDPVWHSGKVTEDRTDAAGWWVRKLIITPRCRVDALLFVPFRAPWGYVSISASRLEDTTDDLAVAIDIPGWDRISVAVPLIGAVGRAQKLIRAPATLTPDPEEVAFAKANASAFLSHAIAEHWTGDFMGWPVIASPFTVEQARERAPALRAQPNPNQTGIHGWYAVTLAPLIWCRDGVCRDAFETVLDIAQQWLDRPATWLTQQGDEIESWPARPALTMHHSKPWIDSRSDPYDDLGHGKGRGSSWTVGEWVGHDNMHEGCELLAVAAMATIDPAFAVAARAKIAALTYDRSWVGYLDGSWSMPPQGRTAARPWLALLALAGLSEQARETAERVSEVWSDAMLRGIRSRNIPRAMPAQVGALLRDGLHFEGYEEGLIALAALRRWRMFGDARDLEISYLCGRTVATTIYWQPDGSIGVGYVIPFRGDGVPTTPSDGVIIAARDLATWSVGGLNAFLAARVAMHALGIAGEADDATWIEIALRARRELTRDLALDSHAQSIVRVNQTLWDVGLEALVTAPATP